MTHFTTRERGTDTVLRRPDTSRRQGSISSLIPRLNHVHHSTSAFVEIAVSPRCAWTRLFVGSQSREYISLTFSQIFFIFYFLSRVGVELFRVFQLDRSLNNFAFLSTTWRNARRANSRGIYRLSVVVFTTTCTSFGWNAIGFLGPSRRSGNRPRIPSPSNSNRLRAAYANARVVLYCPRPLIWHFVNSQKTPETRRRCRRRRCTPVSDNTRMENLLD